VRLIRSFIDQIITSILITDLWISVMEVTQLIRSKNHKIQLLVLKFSILISLSLLFNMLQSKDK